jgi:hypothetical protein
VNDPVILSLVVNGADAPVKSFPVYMYRASALARGEQNVVRIRTPSPTAGRIRFIRRENPCTDFVRMAVNDMGMLHSLVLCWFCTVTIASQPLGVCSKLNT